MKSTVEREVDDRDSAFVNRVFEICRSNKGMAARLRRADNPSTEYQAWEFLAAWGVNLEREEDRLPHVLIASAIAKSKASANGSLPLGQALALSYDNGRDSSPASARLKRLLACDSVKEVCMILRGVLSLISSKLGKPLDYTKLLKQLKKFKFNPQAVKAQWAQEFYSYGAREEQQEN
ncbi:MAG: type I-E CRISPR-associated protein Cse2/CasB [Candidatus Dadabacteria bacterium]|nr:MAG: type I-E CRISPR-associated protein Cse2/CasB [Candidatus Dadabacteria bacterium]